MLDFLINLFDTGDFPPRWQCGSWSDGHGWLHIVSDAAIFGAYASIPLLLAHFALRRRDIPFLPVFWLFAVFILSCGIGHLVESTIFWHPWYRLSGLVKLITAIVSWATVFALVPVMPRALALPGLAKVNAQLEAEISERQTAERKIQAAYDELQRFTGNVLDREDRIMDLKREVNGLLRDLGREARYATEATDG